MIPMNKEQLKALAIKLHEINALKFGDFEMKVGMRSPVYFDLRVIISYPDVMVSQALNCISVYFHRIIFRRISSRIYCWNLLERKTLSTIISVVCRTPRFRSPHWCLSKTRNQCSFVAKRRRPTEQRN